MITRAVILAAGRGVQIGDHDGPNCMARVGRESLIERTLRVLGNAGIRHVAIVVGWQGQALKQFLCRPDVLPAHREIDLTFFEYPHWDKPNGLSVLVARSFVTERTLLVMADQIAAPALVTDLVHAPAAGDRTLLCIDRDLARVFDIDDATKVRLRGA
ncbi:MAG: NTP transferase domain-containing protein, partial [Deltaproteobacteria bacterium]|nr:NTP transferase domain-containing protein [Deltaproteobacteria bacterium]